MGGRLDESHTTADDEDDHLDGLEDGTRDPDEVDSFLEPWDEGSDDES